MGETQAAPVRPVEGYFNRCLTVHLVLDLADERGSRGDNISVSEHRRQRLVVGRIANNDEPPGPLPMRTNYRLDHQAIMPHRSRRNVREPCRRSAPIVCALARGCGAAQENGTFTPLPTAPESGEIAPESSDLSRGRIPRECVHKPVNIGPFQRFGAALPLAVLPAEEGADHATQRG